MGGVRLAARYALDAGAHDLAIEGGLEGGEGDDGRGFGAHRFAGEEGNHQEEPEDHHYQRDRAHGVHIGAGQPRQRFDRRQAGQRQQGADDDAARHGDQRQAQRKQQAVADEGQARAPDREVEFTHLGFLAEWNNLIDGRGRGRRGWKVSGSVHVLRAWLRQTLPLYLPDPDTCHPRRDTLLLCDRRTATALPDREGGVFCAAK